jgi:serine protease Do
MKRISKPVMGFAAAAVGALVVLGALQFTLQGKESEAAPRVNVQEAPINRDTRGLTSFAPIIKRAAPSVVNIYSTRTIRGRQLEMNPHLNDPFFRHFFGPQGDPQGRPPRPFKDQGLGSGVIVSPDGYILTANHVVDGADEIKVALPNGGKEFTAKVVGTDPPTDVAVLKISADDLPAVTLADSDKLEVGDVVLAIGNPFDVGQTVTMGIVSALGRTSLQLNEYENFIQTDAAINPGNSGGALVDAEGRLVGINTAIYSRSGGNQGLGFAVPANLARSVMERLVSFGKVTRGYLGISLQPEINAGLMEAFNLPDQRGAMVGGVNPETPAEKAELQNGDVIREVDGKKIADSKQLRLMISQTAPGTKVKLTLLRGEHGKKPSEKTVTVTLGTLPGDLARRGGRMAPDDDKASGQDSLDGVEVSDLDANSRRQFDVPGGVRGALVTNVDPDSNAAEAGLRQGDVILEIDQEPVRGADSAVKLSEKAKEKWVLLRVWRGGASFFISVDNTKEK